MDEVFIGELAQFPYNFCPAGWAYCHGQLLSIAENDVLYNLLGTSYGGDGIQTFGLPDLRPKDENGNVIQLRVGEVHNGKVFIETYIALEGIYPSMS
jgi:microcystin-dependent protein